MTRKAKYKYRTFTYYPFYSSLYTMNYYILYVCTLLLKEPQNILCWKIIHWQNWCCKFEFVMMWIEALPCLASLLKYMLPHGKTHIGIGEGVSCFGWTDFWGQSLPAAFSDECPLLSAPSLDSRWLFARVWSLENNFPCWLGNEPTECRTPAGRWCWVIGVNEQCFPDVEHIGTSILNFCHFQFSRRTNKRISTCLWQHRLQHTEVYSQFKERFSLNWRTIFLKHVIVVYIQCIFTETYL